jgi:mannose/fructose/N-acetylgalactosamine-specific phosphotransferase system component IIC
MVSFFLAVSIKLILLNVAIVGLYLCVAIPFALFLLKDAKQTNTQDQDHVENQNRDPL